MLRCASLHLHTEILQEQKSRIVRCVYVHATYMAHAVHNTYVLYILCMHITGTVVEYRTHTGSNHRKAKALNGSPRSCLITKYGDSLGRERDGNSLFSFFFFNPLPHSPYYSFISCIHLMLQSTAKNSKNAAIE